ncbi:MAG TPA: hypothetical protein VFL57_18245 [Bryobacteraceae bacterium]|nr:hypothetical protein [Bryobacteraceae bacterium]
MVKGPVVRDAVTPGTSETPRDRSQAAPQWKEGDPVRVRPDLKTSPAPRVSDPVKPGVREGKVGDAPVVKQPNASVTVRPDLRESPKPAKSRPKKKHRTAPKHN